MLLIAVNKWVVPIMLIVEFVFGVGVMPEQSRSTWKEASLALANWLEIDLEHLENQMILAIEKSTNSTRKDILRLHYQAMQIGPVYISCSLSTYVHAGRYASSSCHKAFTLNRSGHLHDCHSCSGQQFHRLHDTCLDSETYH